MITESVPPFGSSTPSCMERVSGSSSWRILWTRRAFRPRSVDCSDLIESSSSRTSTGIARLFSSNLKRVVKKDIRIQHERLDLCRNPDPRVWGGGPAQVFHRGWEYPVNK